MDGLLRRFRADLRRHSLLPEDGRIVVAVSGGTDSIVLLDLFHRVAIRDGLHLVVAHANHQLRGEASDRDEAFVLGLAARLGHPAVSGRLDVRAEMARSRTSVEMSARKLRHAFLARTAAEHRASVVALAHHADDQAELFLLRLLRGAGGEGLGGMAWNSPSPADPSRTLVRPLLGLPKAELLAHLKAKRLESREDSSNEDRDILRNRIRHELLPVLERDFTPAI
ncbi:MAG: tRNA lysidine(34) synthetase TilS, partial [Verrucomicrobiota bacterium]